MPVRSRGVHRTVTRLGEAIASGGFAAIAGISAEEILFRYDD